MKRTMFFTLLIGSLAASFFVRNLMSQELAAKVDAHDFTTLQRLATALESYFIDNNSYR